MVLHVVTLEQRDVIFVERHLVGQIRRCAIKVGNDVLAGGLIVNQQPLEIRSEMLPNHPDQKAGLFVDGPWRPTLRRFFFDQVPDSDESVDVRLNLILGGRSSRRPHRGRERPILIIL